MIRVGDRVLYRLRAFDAQEVNDRRDNFQNQQSANSHGIHPHPHDAGWSGAPGYVAHIGLPAHEGEECAADVTRVNPSGTLNLRVLCDGTDLQWLRNVPEGTDPGEWRRYP